MIYVLVLAAALWFLGHQVGAPKSARWIMLGLLYVAVMGALVILPAGHSLQTALGGTSAEWATLGVLGILVFGYSKLVRRLRNRAQETEPPQADPGTLRDTELSRYARHIVMREIGGPGQKALKEARVLVIGAGGLGSPALLYLAAAGVGTIGVIDGDDVEATNLQRQVIHADSRIGTPKVFSAQTAMIALNPFVIVRPYHRRLTEDIAAELFADYDLILDGTDNFETRYLVNATASALGIPLIAAALTQWEGQISVYDPKSGTPCYACVFPNPPAPELVPSCAEAGVVSPLPGVIGSMMAVEAIKVIAGAGSALAGRLMIYDALYADTRIMTVSPRAECEVCASHRAGALDSTS